VNQLEASRRLTDCFDSWNSTLVRNDNGVTGGQTVAEDLVPEVTLCFYSGLSQAPHIEKPRHDAAEILTAGTACDLQLGLKVLF